MKKKFFKNNKYHDYIFLVFLKENKLMIYMDLNECTKKLINYLINLN